MYSEVMNWFTSAVLPTPASPSMTTRYLAGGGGSRFSESSGEAGSESTFAYPAPQQLPSKGERSLARLLVEFTLVLLRDRRDIIESPQLTTLPLLMEKCRRRYRSSLARGLYGLSGREHTRGRT